MRALKYYVACTVDGFIAHADGSFDGFLPEGEHVADFLGSYKWFDTVLMGRKTYEVGLRDGKTNPYPMLRSYVFSRAMKASPDPNVTLISQNAAEVVRGLRRESGKDIWLCGGADLAATLPDHDSFRNELAARRRGLFRAAALRAGGRRPSARAGTTRTG